MKLILIFTLLTYTLFAQDYAASISNITPKIKKRMIKGNSWKRGCPVGTEDLRYLKLAYHGFDGKPYMGELIVHKDAAKSTVKVFEELYDIGYPIRQMRLVSDFKGKDWQSIEADNTSALNCRYATGRKKWSNHAYGKAIDINPIENPYISRTGHIAHKASLKFAKRKHNPNRGSKDKALITKHDKAYNIFIKNGWSWGGEWSGIKDYQHFDYGEKPVY